MPAHVLIVQSEADPEARRSLEYALAYLVEPRPPDAEIDPDHDDVEPPLVVPIHDIDKASIAIVLLGPEWESSEKARSLTLRALDLRRAGRLEVVGVLVRGALPDAALDGIRVVPRDPEGRVVPVERGVPVADEWLSVARTLEPLFREHAYSSYFAARRGAPEEASPARKPSVTRKPIAARDANAHVPPGPVTVTRHDTPPAGVPVARHEGEPVWGAPGLRGRIPGELVMGRYRLGRLRRRELGGDVFDGEMARGARVSLKLQRSGPGEDGPTNDLRFAREVDVLAQLSGPHVPRVYDFGSDEGAGRAIVMEPCSGEMLSARLQRTGALSLAAVHSIFEQVLLALSEVHRAGVLHAHVQLSKIWLEAKPNGETVAKLCDFGGCLRRGNADDLEDEGVEPGFFSFAAPEMFGRRRSAGAPADLYSVGACLFAALSGHLPFEAKSPVKLAELKSTSEPPRLGDVTLKPVSPALETFLSRLLARRAEHRFPTADETLKAWAMLR
ncbi:MAG: serine/threonine-protein kinase [Polyangiaceae bacterium]